MNPDNRNHKRLSESKFKELRNAVHLALEECVSAVEFMDNDELNGARNKLAFARTGLRSVVEYVDEAMAACQLPERLLLKQIENSSTPEIRRECAKAELARRKANAEREESYRQQIAASNQ